jgi:hypothetical protein
MEDGAQIQAIPIIQILLEPSLIGTRSFSTSRDLNHNINIDNKTNVAFSPQANYTDRATAACRRS